MGWGDYADQDEVRRLVPLLRAGKGVVSTKPSCIQVAMAVALREAEAELAEWTKRCARLADPDHSETRWPEALAEARAALAEREAAA